MPRNATYRSVLRQASSDMRIVTPGPGPMTQGRTIGFGTGTVPEECAKPAGVASGTVPFPTRESTARARSRETEAKKLRERAKRPNTVATATPHSGRAHMEYRPGNAYRRIPRQGRTAKSPAQTNERTASRTLRTATPRRKTPSRQPPSTGARSQAPRSSEPQEPQSSNPASK